MPPAYCPPHGSVLASDDNFKMSKSDQTKVYYPDENENINSQEEISKDLWTPALSKWLTISTKYAYFLFHDNVIQHLPTRLHTIWAKLCLANYRLHSVCNPNGNTKSKFQWTTNSSAISLNTVGISTIHHGKWSQWKLNGKLSQWKQLWRT